METKGFSMLELVVTMSIVFVLFSIIAVSFSVFKKSQALGKATTEIMLLLNQARSKTLSSENFSQYGVHFEANRAVLFKGTTFTEPAPDNIELVLSNLVEIYSISLRKGGSDLAFERISGETGSYGVLRLRIKSDTSSTKSVNIKHTGVVDID